jgi:hypothetical protein
MADPENGSLYPLTELSCSGHETPPDNGSYATIEIDWSTGRVEANNGQGIIDDSDGSGSSVTGYFDVYVDPLEIPHSALDTVTGNGEHRTDYEENIDHDYRYWIKGSTYTDCYGQSIGYDDVTYSTSAPVIMIDLEECQLLHNDGGDVADVDWDAHELKYDTWTAELGIIGKNDSGVAGDRFAFVGQRGTGTSWTEYFRVGDGTDLSMWCHDANVSDTVAFASSYKGTPDIQIWRSNSISDVWLEIGTPSGSEHVDIYDDGSVNVTDVYKVNGTQVVSDQAAHEADAPADASEAHALNSTFDDTEVEGALDDLGGKINSVATTLNNLLAKLTAGTGHGLLASS